MKTNDEKILKYLADMLDENETNDFEKEIVESYELKTRLENFQNRLYDLKVNSASLDERYFSNLLPKVHQKLDTEAKSRSVGIIYHLVPYVAAGINGLMFLFNPAHNFDSEYKDLAVKVVNNMSDQDVARKYFDELDAEPSLLESTNNNDDSFGTLVPSNMEVNSEAASKILNGTVIDEYSTLYNYSDDQLKVIAANLNKLNIK